MSSYARAFAPCSINTEAAAYTWLPALYKAEHLEQLEIGLCNRVTEAGVTALQTKFPGRKIIWTDSRWH